MLEFGSPEAAKVVEADKALRARLDAAAENKHLEGRPYRRYRVRMEVTQNHYVDARTMEEAMEIAERRYDGEAWDAEIA